MGFLGKEPVKTPRLDAFAKESKVLTDAASNFPVCSPYRAMFMSGQYPFSNGVLGNCNSNSAKRGIELRESDTCWSDVVKASGYSTGYIGKWHLDSPHEPYIDCKNNQGNLKWNEWCPPERRHGFDFWYAYGTYDFHDRPMYWKGDAKRDEFHYVDQWGPEHEADLAIEFINNTGEQYRDSEKPFALVVSINPPHTPYSRVPQKYLELYDDVSDEQLISAPNVPEVGTQLGDFHRNSIRNYYAMISGVDEQFGRILDAVQAAGIEKETVIIFTSDHGDCIGVHEVRHKPSHFEEAMQIPFVIRWPEHIEVGEDDCLLSTPDIYPTLLGLLGLEDSIPDEVEGTNLADTLLGKEGPRPTSQLYMKPSYFREDGTALRGIRNHRYTYVEAKEDFGKTFALYDRQTDPYQLKNVAEENPDIVYTLREELRVWLEKTSDPWLMESAPSAV